MYNFLERLACRFLEWRFRVGYGTFCGSVEDWRDGDILEDGGCYECKANFVVKFLKEHREL